MFLLFSVNKKLRKWFAVAVVVLVFSTNLYYHLVELGGIVPIRLTSITFSTALCAFLASYFLNIYDKKVQELSVAKDEAEAFKKVVESISLKVYLVSKSGEIKFVNASVLNHLGSSREELIGKNILHVSMPGDFTRLMGVLEEKPSGELINIEVEGKTKGGKIQSNELCASFVNYEGEELCLAVLRDVTEFKEARELEKKNEISKQRLEEKNKFLSIISHELRTPLNGIIGMLEMLEIKQTDEQHEIRDIVQSSSNRLMEVLNDMLSITKLEQGNLKVINSNFELTGIIDRVVELLMPNSRSHNTKVDLNLPKELVINTDKHKIEQILTNIISNAIKFTKDGTVSINVFNSEGDLVIDVNDNGVGIPKEKQDYIFEMFAQADERTARTFGGLGLGLTITKKLVNLLGGVISMESVEGLGSTFTISIPDVIAYDAQVELEKERAKQAKPIAIVEDNNINRKVLRMMVNQLGYESVEFEDGETFLMYDDMTDFSFVLLDIRLPQISGEEVLEKLKADGKELPKFIAMTAHVMESDKEELLGIGFDEFLGKPFLIEDLKKLLDK